MTRSDALAHVESLERGAVPNNAKVDAEPSTSVSVMDVSFVVVGEISASV